MRFKPLPIKDITITNFGKKSIVDCVIETQGVNKFRGKMSKIQFSKTRSEHDMLLKVLHFLYFDIIVKFTEYI